MTGLGNLSTGFLQGFTTVGNYLGQQEDRAYRRERDQQRDKQWEKSFGLQQAQFDRSGRQWEAQFERQGEQWDKSFDLKTQQYERQGRQWAASHALDRERFNLSKQKHAADMRKLNREERDLMLQREAQAAEVALDAYMRGQMPVERVLESFQRIGVDPTNYLEGAVIPEALAVATEALQVGDFSSPDLVDVADVLLKQDILEGVGETYTDKDGKTWEIVDKELAGLVPGPRPGTVGLDLRIFERAPDGETRVREGVPVTGPDRSHADEQVQFIEVEKIMERVAGHQAITQAVNAAPRLRAELEQVRARAGATSTRDPVTLSEGAQLVDPRTGRVIAHNPKGGGAAGGGLAGGMDSTEAKRVMDRARTGVQDVFRTHLGEQFIGNPENAQVHSFASQATFDVVDAAYRMGIHAVPESVGAFAAEVALSGRIPGLKAAEAQQMADAEYRSMPRSERRGNPEYVQQRAIEIQAEAQGRLREEVLRRVAGNPNDFVASDADDTPRGSVTVGSASVVGRGPAPAGALAGPSSAPAAEPSAGLQSVAPSAPASSRPGLMPAPDVAPPSADAERNRAVVQELAGISDEPSRGTQIGEAARDRIKNDYLVQFVTRGIQYGQRPAVEEFSRLVSAIPGKEKVAEFVSEAKDAVAALFGSAPPNAQQQLKPFIEALAQNRPPSKADTERAVRWVMANPDAVSMDAKLTLQFWLEHHETGGSN